MPLALRAAGILPILVTILVGPLSFADALTCGEWLSLPNSMAGSQHALQIEEQAWNLRDHGHFSEADALESGLLKSLAKAAKPKHVFAAKTKGHPDFVELGHDLYGVFKTRADFPELTKREIAAYNLARLFGFRVPVTVDANVGGRDGSLQLYLGGLPMGNNWSPSLATRIFDWLTAQADRHEDNILLLPDHSEVLIDNESSFGWRPRHAITAEEARAFCERHPVTTARILDVRLEPQIETALNTISRRARASFFDRLHQLRRLLRHGLSGNG